MIWYGKEFPLRQPIRLQDSINYKFLFKLVILRYKKFRKLHLVQTKIDCTINNQI